MQGKFWSDRMREWRARLFWTLVDCWPKKKGDKCRAGQRGQVGMSAASLLGVRTL